jgi:Zn-dependent alcohol dehydrogenase
MLTTDPSQGRSPKVRWRRRAVAGTVEAYLGTGSRAGWGERETDMSTRQKAAAVVLGVVAAGALAVPAAQAGGREVIATGRCNEGSSWKLKVGLDDGRLDVSYEVDSNRVGQTWTVRLRDNGTLIFSGTRRTQAPSGSFDVDLQTANRPGPDRVTAFATTASTGESCFGSVTF